ncbi:hypothetical protein H4R20_002674 [Coemansia guatemalensis]|uniref:CID domain-containing protein n=1 Tax=Coemansia guatemalensis TaxID=2761395 RepID=A0A9W8LUF3_9FUNG|nr:hypothetical protein H4R20_002674 [Coemansia guatemalensis]
MDEMDPFEARLLFGNMLDNLTGAQPTIDRVSAFAVKNASMADNLFDCIDEKLEKIQVPPRLNILLVLDGILGTGASNGRANSTSASAAQSWSEVLKKDIVRIVKAVVPETPGGDSNVPQVRKVAAGWRRKSIFDESTMDQIEKLLANRAGDRSAGGTESSMKNQDIMKRIEEDRERHKRHKEDVWIRPAYEPPADELDAYWETTSDFNDADWLELSVENDEFRHERQISAMQSPI